jgi:histone deacetylase 6
MTHLREKLIFVESENTSKKETIVELEARLNRLRSLISSLKQDRDETTPQKQDLETKQQFAKHVALLKDYEHRKECNESLKVQLECLKNKYLCLKERMELTNKQSKILTNNENLSIPPIISSLAWKPHIKPKTIFRSQKKAILC